MESIGSDILATIALKEENQPAHSASASPSEDVEVFANWDTTKDMNDLKVKEEREANDDDDDDDDDDVCYHSDNGNEVGDSDDDDYEDSDELKQLMRCFRTALELGSATYPSPPPGRKEAHSPRAKPARIRRPQGIIKSEPDSPPQTTSHWSVLEPELLELGWNTPRPRARPQAPRAPRPRPQTLRTPDIYQVPPLRPTGTPQSGPRGGLDHRKKEVYAQVLDMQRRKQIFQETREDHSQIEERHRKRDEDRDKERCGGQLKEAGRFDKLKETEKKLPASIGSGGYGMSPQSVPCGASSSPPSTVFGLFEKGDVEPPHLEYHLSDTPVRARHSRRAGAITTASTASRSPARTPTLTPAASSVVSIAPPAQRKLACPFFKRSPRRHANSQACTGPGWDTTHRLKEHLYRRHCRPPHCLRCYAEFKTSQQLNAHTRSDPPCQLSVSDGYWEKDGMTLQQEKLLRSRKRDKGAEGGGEEAKWNKIYRILFPQDNPCRIPPPYYDLEPEPQESLPALLSASSSPTNRDTASPPAADLVPKTLTQPLFDFNSQMDAYLESFSKDLPAPVMQEIERKIDAALGQLPGGDTRGAVAETLKQQVADIVRDAQRDAVQDIWGNGLKMKGGGLEQQAVDMHQHRQQQQQQQEEEEKEEEQAVNTYPQEYEQQAVDACQQQDCQHQEYQQQEYRQQEYQHHEYQHQEEKLQPPLQGFMPDPAYMMNPSPFTAYSVIQQGFPDQSLSNGLRHDPLGTGLDVFTEANWWE